VSRRSYTVRFFRRPKMI